MPFTKHNPNLDRTCKSPEHNPPSHIVLMAGSHTWQCPSCKQEKVVNVQEATL